MRSEAASDTIPSRRSRRVRPAEEAAVLPVATGQPAPAMQEDVAVLAESSPALVPSARRSRRALNLERGVASTAAEPVLETPAAPLSRRARRLAATPVTEEAPEAVIPAEVVDAPVADAVIAEPVVTETAVSEAAVSEPVATMEPTEPEVPVTPADEASSEPVVTASEAPGTFTASTTNPIPTMSTFDDLIAQAIRAEEPAADEAPTREAFAPAEEPAHPEAGHADEKHVRPRRPRSVRRIAAKVTSVSALIAAGMLTVATSLPANALLTSADVQAEQQAAIADGSTEYGTDAVQSLSSASGVTDTGIERDSYGVMSANEAAAEEGITPESGTFTNNPNGTIQWPFAVGVHIGSGYGPRAGCSIGCSTNHMGQDFNPGYGARIQAIADGVVVESTDSGGAYGVKIVIEHEINGQTIRSLYGHMITGSRQVEVGDRVTVGQYIGQTGSTGISTGAHLHLEIFVNGTNVDPLAWLYENTN